MTQTFSLLFKNKQLRGSILIVLGMLVIFRICAHIPIPGIDIANLKIFLQNNQLLGLLNIFSGGTFENFSVIVLGVGPYITASIILQLMTMVVPRLEELSKEGEYGQRKINQYTRYLTVPLAFIQGYGVIKLLEQSQIHIVSGVTIAGIFIMLLTLAAGTVFLMWLGELISDHKIGNGISLLIFAGIVAGLPGALQRALLSYTSADLIPYALFVGIALITVVGVVYLSEAVRNIDVVYARHIRAGAGTGGGVQSHLPLKLNMGGVIPIIFAISVVLFPSLVAQFFIYAKTPWIAGFAKQVIAFFNNNTYYGIVFFILVVAFSFFYTSIIFKPNKIAENLQKQGGFIPGVRPGLPTEHYIRDITYRILLPGSIALGLIAILPIFLRAFTGSQVLTIGGTSVLIAVSVVIEVIKQVEAQISMRSYDM